MRGTWALTSSALAAITVVACATATGHVEPGAEKFDASQPDPPPRAVARCDIERGSGEKWSDLYRDFFGSREPGSCTFQSNCHGSPEQAGAKASNGYICDSKDHCRATLLATELVKETDKTAPESAALFAFIRTRRDDDTFKGSMPQQPRDCAFTPTSVQRIQKWIANGAPND